MKKMRFTKVLSVITAAALMLGSIQMPAVNAAAADASETKVETSVETDGAKETATEETGSKVEETDSSEVKESGETETAEKTGLTEIKYENPETAASEASTENGIITGVYINPVYEYLVTDEQYQEFLDAANEAAAEAKTQAESNENTAVFMAGSNTVEAAGATLKAGIKSRQNNIKFTVNLDRSKYNDASDLFAAVLAAAYDTDGAAPDEGDYLRYHVYAWGYSVSYSGDVYNFTCNKMTYWTSATDELQVDAAVESLLSSLNLEGKSDYEKTKIIYEWMTNNIGYDYATLSATNNGKNITSQYYKTWSAYGGLINRTCVCQGYANLLYRLLEEEGIDCRIVDGKGNNQNHAWNIVKIGNLYYNTDSTWDEGVTYNSGVGKKNYFLKNYSDFSGHVRASEYSTSEFNTKYPISAYSINVNTGLPNTSGTDDNDSAASTSGLYNNANASYTFNTISGGTVSSTASGKAKIIVFGDSGTKTSNYLKELESKGITSHADVIFAGITYSNSNASFTASSSNVTSIKNKVGTTNITYCYDTSTANYEAMRTYMGKAGYSSFSYSPCVVLIDSNNKVRYGQDYNSASVDSLKNAMNEVVPTSLSAPTGVTASASAGKITVSWNAVTGADSYNVYRAVKGSTFSKLATVTGTSYTDNIDTYGEFTYKVTAIKTLEAKSNDSASVNAVLKGATEIKYVLDSDVNNSANPTSYIEGNVVSLVAPTRTGYDFGGWYLNSGLSIAASNPAISAEDTGVKTFYAKWTPKEVTVTFSNTVYSNDQASYGQPVSSDVPSLSKTSVTAKYKTAITGLANITLKGSDFLGWYTKEGKQIKENDISTFTESVTVYPRWKAKNYTISFAAYDANGEVISVSDMIVKYGSAVGTLPVPQRSDKIFKSWNKSGTKINSNTLYTYDTNITLSAEWTENPVNVYMLSDEGREDLEKGVNLQNSKYSDAVGSYETLKAAMAAIDTIGDKNEVYVIEVENGADLAERICAGGFTLPKNAAGLVFVGKTEDESGPLVSSAPLTFTIPVTFINIDFTGNKNLVFNNKITLYKSNIKSNESLTVKDVRLAGIIMNEGVATPANYVNSLTCPNAGSKKFTQSGINEVIENSGAKIYINGNDMTASMPVRGTSYVGLYSYNNGNKNAINTYATVQEAFNAIEALKNKNNDYLIELISSDSEAVFGGTALDLKLPANCASLTIKSADDNAKKLAFKKDIALKSSLYLNNLILQSGALANINMSNFTLGLENVVFDTYQVGNITGGGENGASKLIMNNSEKFTVTGNVTRIGTVVMKSNPGMPLQTIIARGTFSAGTIELESDSRIMALATTAYKDGKIVRLTSGASVTKDIYSTNGAKLEIALYDKISGKTVTPEMLDSSLLASGIQILKAPAASTDYVWSSAAGTDVTYKKTGGYIYSGNFNNAFILSYNNGKADVTSGFDSWAEVIKEINTLKTARDYTIKVTSQGQMTSIAKPAALTMPSKTSVNTLTIDGAKETGTNTLFYTGALTFGVTKVVLKDIILEQAVKVGSTYMAASDSRNPSYPAVVQVNLSGNTLAIAGNTRIVNPVKLNGGGNASVLVLEEGSCLKGFSQDYHYSNVYMSAVSDAQNAMRTSLSADVTHELSGEILNLGYIKINSDQVLKITETLSKKNGTDVYAKINFTVNELSVDGGLLIGEQLSGNVININTLEIGNTGKVFVKGSVTTKTISTESTGKFMIDDAAADLYEQSSDGSRVWIGQYKTVTDAANAINKLNNRNGVYVISLLKNIDASSWNFTLPNTAASVTITKDSGLDRCTIDAGAKAISVKQNTTFSFVDVKANSITAPAKNTIYLENATFDVKGALNVCNITVTDSADSSKSTITTTARVTSSVRNGVRSVTGFVPNFKMTGLIMGSPLNLVIKDAATGSTVNMSETYAAASAALKATGLPVIGTTLNNSIWNEALALQGTSAEDSFLFWSKNNVCYKPNTGSGSITVKNVDGGSENTIAVVPGIEEAIATVEGIKNNQQTYVFEISENMTLSGLKTLALPQYAKKTILRGTTSNLSISNSNLALNIKSDLGLENITLNVAKLTGTGVSGKTNLSLNSAKLTATEVANISNVLLSNSSTIDFTGKFTVGTITIVDAASVITQAGLTYYQKGDSYPVKVTSNTGIDAGFKTYNDAVKFINNENNLKAEYIITVQKDTFNSASVITFPTKANSVLITVTGTTRDNFDEADSPVQLYVKGVTFPSKVKAGFKNIDVVPVSVSGSGAWVLLDNCYLITDKPVTADKLYVQERAAVQCSAAIKIGDITGVTSDDVLNIYTCRTKGTDFSKSRNQLTITGVLENAKLKIATFDYQFNDAQMLKAAHKTSYGAYNDVYAIGTMPKVNPAKVFILDDSITTDEDKSGYSLAKKTGKLYVSSQSGDYSLPVKIKAYNSESEAQTGDTASALYYGECENLAQAAAEIDSIGRMDYYWQIEFTADLGASGAPVAANLISFPQKCAGLYVASKTGYTYTVHSFNANYTFKTDTNIKGVNFKSYNNNRAAINPNITGPANKKLTIDVNGNTYDDRNLNYASSVTVTDLMNIKGFDTVTLSALQAGSNAIALNSITGVKNVKAKGVSSLSVLIKTNSTISKDLCLENTKLTLYGKLDVSGNAELTNSEIKKGMTASNDLNIKTNLVMNNSTVKAGNITVTKSLVISNDTVSKLEAGSTKVGDGKINLNEIRFNSISATSKFYITGKQDGKGNSLITVNGAVVASGNPNAPRNDGEKINVTLNSSVNSRLTAYNGLTVMNLKNTKVNENYFVTTVSSGKLVKDKTVLKYKK